MSGIGKTGGPDLNLLERLSKAPGGVIKVDETGNRFTMDQTGMTFRSGLHRMFRQDKSEEDIQQNKSTLRSILDEIGQKAGQDVLDEVMTRNLKLGGDRETYTVGDRLQRGTYVSSTLVKELLQITRSVIAEKNEAIAEQQMLDAQKMEPFKEESRTQVDNHLPKCLSENLKSLRDDSGIRDDHTWNRFLDFVDGNKGRITSSFDDRIEDKARWDSSLSYIDVHSGVSSFLSKTLLPEFLGAQPQRKSLEELSDGDIAKAVRQRLDSFDQRHVDRFVEDLLTKKKDEDDDDTSGMKNLRSLRDSVAVQLNKQGREMVSDDELVEMLDTRQLSDMLSEHVRRRRD
jgi:hypothetical protein